MELAQMCLVFLQGEIRTQTDTRKGGTNMYRDTERKTASQSWRLQKKPCPPTPLFTRLLGSSTGTKGISVAQVTPAMVLLWLPENTHPVLQAFLTVLMMTVTEFKVVPKQGFQFRRPSLWSEFSLYASDKYYFFTALVVLDQ